MLLHIADDGSLGNRSERQHVAYDKIGLLTAVNELARLHTLSCDEKLLLVPVAEGVPESYLAEQGTAPWVMDEIRDNALNVAIALPIVEAAKADRNLLVVRVGSEQGPRSLPLCSDHPPRRYTTLL